MSNSNKKKTRHDEEGAARGGRRDTRRQEGHEAAGFSFSGIRSFDPVRCLVFFCVIVSEGVLCYGMCIMKSMLHGTRGETGRDVMRYRNGFELDHGVGFPSSRWWCGVRSGRDSG